MNKAQPSPMWAITYESGRSGVRFIYQNSMRRTRSATIAAHVKVCNCPWLTLKKEGERCVPVLVSEA